MIGRLIALELEPADFVIFGGAPLLVHGLRRNIRDVDVVARGSAWERAVKLGVPATGVLSGAPMVHFWGGLIEVSAEWISPEWDVNELIERADIIGGLRFARLSDVLAYKRSLGRPKDRHDIVLLELMGLRSGPRFE